MILVTGGAGYIGSHLVADLIRKKKDVVIVDNFQNARAENIIAINGIFKINLKVIKSDLLNPRQLEIFLEKNNVDTIFHLAGFKSISQSIENPLDYYNNNVNCTINVLRLSKKYQIKKIIFSSSATVYGNSINVPYKEEMTSSLNNNPYAMTKIICEKLLNDFHLANKDFKISILRYFNPIGTHSSGLIGYNHIASNNLVPNIIDALLNKKRKFQIYGGDYDTPDGTAIRDFIHISDLINGHIKTLNKINLNKGFNIWNLGTGQGHSVLEVIKMFELILNKKIKYKIVKKREGDIPYYWCDPNKAKKDLKWKASKDLKKMVEDEVNFLNLSILKNYDN